MLNRVLLILLITLSIPSAYAHVMVAQHATLKFQNKGAYFLASYPISAFDGVDDNQDGLLDQKELKKHYSVFVQKIRSQVQLTEDGKPKELEGLLINLSHSHTHQKAVSQILVMGRFKPIHKGVVLFYSHLFGKTTHEKVFKIRITLQDKPTDLILTPQNPKVEISQLIPRK